MHNGKFGAGMGNASVRLYVVVSQANKSQNTFHYKNFIKYMDTSFPLYHPITIHVQRFHSSNWWKRAGSSSPLTCLEYFQGLLHLFNFKNSLQKPDVPKYGFIISLKSFFYEKNDVW